MYPEGRAVFDIFSTHKSQVKIAQRRLTSPIQGSKLWFTIVSSLYQQHTYNVYQGQLNTMASTITTI